MNRSGFTLVEIMVVIGIISLLLSIGTIQFSRYTLKYETESQTRKLYSDLLEIRSRALFEKKSRAISLAAGSYSLYSSTDTTAPPVATVTLKRPITNNGGANIVFDTRGMLTGSQSICVSAENDAAIDSIVISMARVQMGKRKEGMVCNADNIIFK